MTKKGYLCAIVNGPAAQANPSSRGSRPESWATPIMGDSHLASTQEVAQKRLKEGKITLSRQMAAWRTPSVAEERNQQSSEQIYLQNQVGATRKGKNEICSGKLNPRWVETLMGLPVGWTMPSCASPVTIAPTNCGSLATESSPQPQNELFAP